MWWYNLRLTSFSWDPRRGTYTTWEEDKFSYISWFQQQLSISHLIVCERTSSNDNRTYSPWSNFQFQILTISDFDFDPSYSGPIRFAIHTNVDSNKGVLNVQLINRTFLRHCAACGCCFSILELVTKQVAFRPHGMLIKISFYLPREHCLQFPFSNDEQQALKILSLFEDMKIHQTKISDWIPSILIYIEHLTWTIANEPIQM